MELGINVEGGTKNGKSINVEGRFFLWRVEFLKNFAQISAFCLLRFVYVVAKVYRRIKYTLAPNFEANVYISPKLQTSRLMCTLSPNLEAKVNLCT